MEKELVKKQVTEIAPVVPMASPETLILKAIEHGVSVESLERLIALRDKFRAEQARASYFQALSGFQGECPIIKKNRTVKNKDGKTTRYKFADAASIDKQTAQIRAKWGLSHSFKSKYENGFMTVLCLIQHVDGHTEESAFMVPIDKEAYMNNQQQVASARTFASRYAMMNGYGIVTGDGDDDATSFDDAPQKESTPQQQAEKAAVSRPKRVVIPEDVQNDVHEKTLLYLDLKEDMKLTELWIKHDADTQVALSQMFDSSQRRQIKEAMTRGLAVLKQAKAEKSK